MIALVDSPTPSGPTLGGGDARPLIAISGQMTVSAAGEKVSSASVLKMKDLVEKQGGRAVIIDPTQENPANVSAYDSMIFMGNNYDIAPQVYHQAKASDTKIETEANGRSDADTFLAGARANYEYAAMGEAFKQNVPMLGVCGGMQRMNVLTGGTLDQHIASDHMQTEDPSTPVQVIQFEQGSELAALAGERRSMYAPAHSQINYRDDQVNSLHHQAVHNVGMGFRVSARSEDGTIEAIESMVPNQYARGVQFHPEHMPDNPLSIKIVDSLVDAARERHEQKQAVLSAPPSFVDRLRAQRSGAQMSNGFSLS